MELLIHTKGMRRRELEHLAIEGLRIRMMASELVAEFVCKFTLAWNRAIAASTMDRDVGARDLAAVERKLASLIDPIAASTMDRDVGARDLAAVERKLASLIDPIAEGIRGPGLQAKMDVLETRKAELVAKLEAPAPATSRLHPNLSEIYRAKVERLDKALVAGTDSQAALEAARSLIERVVLTPLLTGKGFGIELVGEIAAKVTLGAGMPQ